jgi:hypothetical protein
LIDLLEKLALLDELNVDVLGVMVQVLCDLGDLFKLLVLLSHKCTS